MRSRRDTAHSPGFGRRLLCCALLTLLPGCQPNGPDATFETYLRKLGAALELAMPAAATTSVSQPPPPGEMQLDLPGDSLDRLDFMALSGCAVQATVLKRNSSLGRLAKPSQRLLLELEYLRLAPACITQLRSSNNDALADVLEEAWQRRREQLPALIFNATLGSDEYHAFWLATPAPGQYPHVSRSATAAALSAINHHIRRWLGGDYQAHNRDLEVLLSEVAGGDGGALLQALSRQHDWLATANLMLERHMAHGPLCFKQERDSAAAQPSTLTDRYYNSEIPARTAKINGRYHQLLPPIAALEAQLSSAMPQAYRSWMEARNQHLAQFANAPRQHLKRLSLAQQSCARE